jgi:hypothetical protein
MCFQPSPIGQVDRMRDNIIDRNAAVGIEERIRIVRNIRDVKPLFCGIDERWLSAVKDHTEYGDIFLG